MTGTPPVSGKSEDVVRETVAARLAWWWRMTQLEVDDLDDPRAEASWWDQAASVAITATKEGR